MRKKGRNMISPENVVRHELIGLQAEVAESQDKKKKGIRGMITDETQKTLTIRSEKEYMIIKDESVLIITLPSGTKVRVDGGVVRGRPEERTKKKMPKKWEKAR